MIRHGQDAVRLATTEMRTFPPDGDEAIFRAHCHTPDRAAIGLARGTAGSARHSK
jgi:hypothetical protein